ncbi:MAG TPA: hypothetical protein VKU80_02035 [Planctomycetota bacterium]|nr:hypothetical protein [Planctomycetota bacterium]
MIALVAEIIVVSVGSIVVIAVLVPLRIAAAVLDMMASLGESEPRIPRRVRTEEKTPVFTQWLRT